MPLEDGSGLRVGSAGRVLLQILWGPDDPVDLSGTRTVTVSCQLNGGALPSTPPTVTEISIDGVEAAGFSGWVAVDFIAANITAAGVITIEPSTSGSPTVNPPEHPVRIPIRAAHADAP